MDIEIEFRRPDVPRLVKIGARADQPPPSSHALEEDADCSSGECSAVRCSPTSLANLTRSEVGERDDMLRRGCWWRRSSFSTRMLVGALIILGWSADVATGDCADFLGLVLPLYLPLCANSCVCTQWAWVPGLVRVTTRLEIEGGGWR